MKFHFENTLVNRLKNILGAILLLSKMLITSQALAQKPPTIVGPAVVAAGVPTTYTVTYSGVNTAMWAVSPTNATVNSAQLTSSPYSISLTWISSGMMTFYDEMNEAIYVSKTVTVVTPPTPTNVTQCGTGPVTLSATVGGGGDQIRWYSTQTGGTAFNTGLTYTTPSLSSTTVYWVETWNSTASVASSRVSITATINPAVATPTVSDVERCGEGTVTLTGTPGSGANTIAWYRTITGGAVHTGIPYDVTLTEAKPVGYYAASINTTTGCASARVPVTAVLHPKLNLLDGYQESVVYGSGSVSLLAVLYQEESEPYPQIDLTGHEVKWYTTLSNAQAETSSIATGPGYITPALTASTTYYIRVRNILTGCKSDPQSVIATITPIISNASVRTDIVRVSGKKTEAAMSALPVSEMASTFSYLDGMGRVQQQVALQASPTSKDLISPVEYDSWGRISKTYLPYAATTTTGVFHSTYKTEQQTFYAASNDKVANDNAPFAMATYEDSPMGRVVEQGGVGTSWQPGAGHTQTVAYTFNTTADQVRKFNSDGSSSGFYTANLLRKTRVEDAGDGHVISFTDGSGNTILERRYLNETISGSLVDYLETYYIYNDRAQLTFILSPKGVAALKAASWAFSQSIKDNFANQFVYDNKGRVVEKKVPGQAWQYIVYDPLGRVVLTQEGILRATNQWMFVKYDFKGNAVMSGLYTNTTQTTRATVQTLVDALYTSSNAQFGVNAWYEKQGTTAHGYTNVSFPNTNIDVLSVNYFDDYDFDNDNTGVPAYTVETLTGEHTPATYTFGLVTGSKRKVLNATTWLYTYIFYDDLGRAIQVRTDNHLNPGAAPDRVTNVYAYDGRILRTKKYHDAGSGRQTTVVNEFEFDAQGRVTKVKQSNNGAAFQTLAKYEYNELGQLVDKKLHNTTAENYLQSVDYRYNIKGQLASINNAALTNDGNLNDETTDYFGMEFLYQNVEAPLGNTADYKGNISAVKWKGPGMETAPSWSVGQQAYKFTYDNVGQLETSTSAGYSGSAWNRQLNALNETMTYDRNGNILTLTRAQKKHQLSGVTATYIAETNDNLTYTYNSATGDRLIKVQDATAIASGFNNGTSGTSNDYTYDGNGNITADLNKGMSSVLYNFLGKPTEVNFSDGRKLEYVYDAAGAKLTMKTWQGTTLVSTTDYANGFVYENATLSFFGSPEGRVVKNGSALEYQYAIVDHQGNTRLLFTSVTPTADAPVATFEGDANDGANQYLNVNGLNVVSHGGANHTIGGSKAVRMNQTYKVGPSKSIKVYPGDKIDMEVWEYHEGSSGFGTSPPNVASFVTAIASAFGGVSGGAGESGAIYNGVTSSLASFSLGGNRGDAAPGAYLNYIMFDKDYNVLDAGFQAAPATTFTKQKISFPTKNITREGYMYVWLSYENESNNWVYFDDLKVTHTKTNIVQYSEYYPFGLQTQNSWTRTNSKNDYLYNSGSELNSTAGWYEMFYRGYDPAIGRMLQVDPYATMYASTNAYNYALNNPVMMNDPSGGQVSAQGLSDGQIRALYRANMWRGYTGFASWAHDNVDFWNGMEGGRSITGTDGRHYRFDSNDWMGYWIDDDRQTTERQDDGTWATVGRRSTFVSAGESQSDESLLERIWNSDLMRLVVPDVLTVDVNYTAALGFGLSETYSLNLITRGKDAGFHKTNTQQFVFGPEWGYGLNFGHLMYSGEVSTLTAETLLGPSRTVSGGLIAGANVNAGYPDWDTAVYSPTLTGVSAGVGLVVGVGYGVGETRAGWTPFTPSVPGITR